MESWIESTVILGDDYRVLLWNRIIRYTPQGGYVIIMMVHPGIVMMGVTFGIGLEIYVKTPTHWKQSSQRKRWCKEQTCGTGCSLEASRIERKKPANEIWAGEIFSKNRVSV